MTDEKTSLRKEQVELLRFEKELIGLGAGLAALTAGAAANAEKVVGPVAKEQAEAIQAAYINLVQTVEAAHYAIEIDAISVGARLFQAKGDPKNQMLLETAKSALGIG